MHDFKVAIYSDRNFTRKSFVDCDNPFFYDGSQSDGASMISAFLYSNEIREYSIKNAGSFRGYRGDCIAAGLHFDFDGETALNDVKDLICRFYGQTGSLKPEDDFRLWFSGNKGFHVLMGLNGGKIGPSKDTPAIVKQICEKIGSRYISFDGSVYDHVRGIRCNRSKHGKSGLYKIELHPTELWAHDISGIRNLAKKNRVLSESIPSQIEHNWRVFNGINA